MINLEEMRQVAQGALLQPDATWAKAKAEGKSAQQMAQALTIPLVLLCAAVNLVLGLVFAREHTATFILGHAAGGAIVGILGVFLLAFLTDVLAGFFGGTRDYNAAFNAVALTAVPSAVGLAGQNLPVVGGIASLVLWFYGLYLLYQALPVFLTIPEEKRMLHYLSTLGAAMVIGLVMGKIVIG
jgi:hypothetical protein